MMDNNGFPKNMAYAIILTANITQEMFNCVRSTINISSQSDLLTSLDGLKTVVQFAPTLSAPFSTETWLNIDELLVELQKAEWLLPSEI